MRIVLFVVTITVTILTTAGYNLYFGSNKTKREKAQSSSKQEYSISEQVGTAGTTTLITPESFHGEVKKSDEGHTTKTDSDELEVGINPGLPPVDVTKNDPERNRDLFVVEPGFGGGIPPIFSSATDNQEIPLCD